MIIASIRNFPRFAAGQQAGHWDPAVSDLVAGKRVLIVGYGSIGEAVERRLAGWEVAIDRVARHARDGVHPIDELPQLLPDADVVVILVPVTERDQAAGQRRVPEDHEGRRAAGQRRPRRDRGHRRAAGRADQPAGCNAALDVTDPEPLPDGHPLWSAPGLLLTPHVGGAVRASRERANRVVADQLARLASGQPLLNVIGPEGY